MAMIETKRTIRAPREAVFEVSAHIEGYAEIIPEITEVEFLTEQRVGVGTRFRETRRAGRRAATTELAVTEYEPPTRVRLVADAGGTTWDTLFTYLTTREGTEIHLRMDVRPRTLLARLTTRFMTGFVVRGIESDLDAIKRHFERSAPADPGEPTD